VGNFYWAVMKKDREMVKRNLRKILENPSEAGKVARQTFVRYAQYLVDYTRMDLLKEDNLGNLVRDFQGKEQIDRALSRGKGAMILTAHLGNWEMGGVFLSLLGYSLNVITVPDVAARLHDYRVRLRQEQRIKVITLNDTLSSSLAVFKALKDNELVALLGDRELIGKGILHFSARVFSHWPPSGLLSMRPIPTALMACEYLCRLNLLPFKNG
jgi:KDO2-lipid IV(A) lauroyltransferase